MRICVAGALGRMGQRILNLTHATADLTVGAAFDLPEKAGAKIALLEDPASTAEVVLVKNAAEALAVSDVLIDFTHAEACIQNVRAALAAGKPAVVGTTGLTAHQQAELARFSRDIAIVFAPNMSVGVNLLFKLTAEVAKVLGLDYNVEITEIHHSLKKDAPSGTAIRLAEKAAQALGLDYHNDVAHGRQGLTGARPARQIGMHALRGGDVVGEHTVSFIGHGERIELTHKAHNRDNFARGALLAARYVVKARPGLYDMQDVLGI